MTANELADEVMEHYKAESPRGFNVNWMEEVAIMLRQQEAALLAEQEHNEMLMAEIEQLKNLEHQGMDLRDYFASQVITGFLANNKTDYYKNSAELMVKLAYEMADLMMKERHKRND